jgi:hypothetical protein
MRVLSATGYLTEEQPVIQGADELRRIVATPIRNSRNSFRDETP